MRFQGRAVGEVGVAGGVVVLLGDQPRVAVAPALDLVDGAIEFALGRCGGNTVPLPQNVLCVVDLGRGEGLFVVPENVAEDAGGVSGGDGGGEGGLVDQEGGSHFGCLCGLGGAGRRSLSVAPKAWGGGRGDLQLFSSRPGSGGGRRGR